MLRAFYRLPTGCHLLTAVAFSLTCDYLLFRLAHLLFS